MSVQLLPGLAAVLSLLPVAGLAARPAPRRDAAFFAALAAAVAGPAGWAYALTADRWHPDFGTTLWVTAAATMAVFALAALTTHAAWRLAPLVAPAMAVLALLGLIWQGADEGQARLAGGTAWVGVHIVVSVTTYALVTLAAVAALSALLQERALKAKRPTGLSRRLPSIADSEALTVRLLALGEGVLLLGLATGMAALYRETGQLIALDHKVILTVASFLVIGGLLGAYFWGRLRGRQAARFVLVAYLLITLGYPGVKFVTDVLIG